MTDPDLLAAPKVLLHDHLDGGLRAETVLELADAAGYTGLPARDPDALAQWFRDSADAGSLPRYIDTFEHTVAVMQTQEAIARVAAEAVIDLAADGVLYAELRFAPALATRRGLGLDEVIDAMVAGQRAGESLAAGEGRSIVTGVLVCGMRQEDSVLDVAQAAIRHHGNGVVGFDLAGPEAGFPASRHADALGLLRAAGVPLTLHAGEAFGPSSVADAVQQGASRIGHGVRVLEDPELTRRVAAQGIVLEVAPTSNLQTGVASSYDEHPFKRLVDAGVRVTVNTDNRLMSGTSVSMEMQHLRDAFGYTLDDFKSFTLTAARSAFLTDDQRNALVAQLA
ncbi:MAG: adenosine deaminase [Actinomycetes bacterium]